MSPSPPGERGPPPVSAEEAGRLLAPLDGARGVLLAVSGGPDSTAMLGLVAAWARGAAARGPRPPIHAATVDHGLRLSSADEAGAVGLACAGLGVPHRVLAWAGAKPASRLQERARAARYALLVAHAQAIGADHLVTAHTLDDQAETVLMRLAHGSGPAGLAGMRARVTRDGIAHLRPFLDTPKARLVATCLALGLPFSDDPSNRDPRHERARWRRAAPLLAAGGLTAARLAALARRAARAEDALALGTERAWARWGGEAERLDFAALLAAEPAEIALRVLGRLAGVASRGGPPSPGRLVRLEALFEALAAASREGRPLRRTFAGSVLALDAAGGLALAPEGPRRRGTGRDRPAPGESTSGQERPGRDDRPGR